MGIFMFIVVFSIVRELRFIVLSFSFVVFCCGSLGLEYGSLGKLRRKMWWDKNVGLNVC